MLVVAAASSARHKLDPVCRLRSAGGRVGVLLMTAAEHWLGSEGISVEFGEDEAGPMPRRGHRGAGHQPMAIASHRQTSTARRTAPQRFGASATYGDRSMRPCKIY
jgi:hypothetical protein